MAVTGRERAGEHQHGGDQRDGARAADRQRQVEHHLGDGFERLAHAHRSGGREFGAAGFSSAISSSRSRRSDR